MSKNKTEAARSEKTEPESFNKGKREMSPALVDEFDHWLAEHYTGPEDLLGKEGLLARLTKRVVERALGAELTHHLGYVRGGVPEGDGGNCRNGTSGKTMIGEGGHTVIAVPGTSRMKRRPAS